MKTIICGSRNIKVTNEMLQEIIYLSQLNVTKIISGMGGLVDKGAIRYAKDKDIPFQEIPAEWNLYGKAAGPIRNQQMVDTSDSLIAIWDGSSKGTLDIITKAKKKSLAVFLWRTYGIPKYERFNY